MSNLARYQISQINAQIKAQQEAEEAAALRSKAQKNAPLD